MGTYEKSVKTLAGKIWVKLVMLGRKGRQRGPKLAL